jgi:cytochrome c
MADGRRNMIIGAVTAALVVALGGAWVGDLAVPENYPAVAGYVVPGMAEPLVDRASLQRSWPAGLDQPGGRIRLIGYMAKVDRGAIPPPAVSEAAGPVAAPEPEVDLGTLLASASAEKGKGAARVCMSCHNFAQGGPNLVGPNLWGVVGRDVGSHGGFAYSKAMATHPGVWSYEELNQYLTKPSRAVPGNKMAFGGIRNAADRANLLAFLGTLGSAPAPFPAAKAAANGGTQVAGR